MAKKNLLSSALVYSTDKDFKIEQDVELHVQLKPGEQILKIRLDTKHRGGKAVTIVDGYKGLGLEETGKQLKVYCGTGGSVKDNQIIVQGDNRDKILQWLKKNGFTNVKKQ